MNWADKAEQELDESLENGDISENEHKVEMRRLRQEMREGADEAAQNARDEYYQY